MNTHGSLLRRAAKCSLSVRKLCTNLTSTGNNRAQAPEPLLCGHFLKSSYCGPLCSQLFHAVYCCQIITQTFVRPSKSSTWPASQIILDLVSLFYVHGSVRRESMSINVHQDATTYSFVIFLQTAVHVSDDTLIHHQEHTQTVITTSGTGRTVFATVR